MYCRLCLNKAQTGEFLSLLSRADGINWKQICWQYLRIEIKYQDDYSKDICVRCVKMLKDFHEFREHATHCQKLLHQLHTKIKKTEKNSNSNISDENMVIGSSSSTVTAAFNPNHTQTTADINDTVAAVIKLEKSDDYINLDNITKSATIINEQFQSTPTVKTEPVDEQYIIETFQSDNDHPLNNETQTIKEEVHFETSEYMLQDAMPEEDRAYESYPNYNTPPAYASKKISSTCTTDAFPPHKKLKTSSSSDYRDFESLSNMQQSQQMDQEEENNSKKRQQVDSSFDLDEAIFRKMYHISTDLAQFLIQNLDTQLRGRRSTAIPTEKLVLATLRFYATGRLQGAVGEFWDINIMSQPLISRAIHRVTDAINDVLCQQNIRFPMTSIERESAKSTFARAPAVFNGAIGIMDCMQVGINAPYADLQSVYFNKDHYHSINVQMICDPTLKILNVNARHPGSKHNAYIWHESAARHVMNRAFEMGDQNTFLIGDANYPLEPWLMTPLQNINKGTPEFRYNDALSKARHPVQRLFGVIRNTWRCLGEDKLLPYKPQFAGRIVNACSVLHNLQLSNNECEFENFLLPDSAPDQAETCERPSLSTDVVLLNTAKRIQKSIVMEYYSN